MASARTAVQRTRSRAMSVARELSGSPGTAVSRNAWRSSVVSSRSNAASTRSTRVVEGQLLLGGDGDGLVGREVVLVRDGGAGRLRAPPRSGPRSRRSSARGAAMSRGARSPSTRLERLLGQDVDAQDRGHRAPTRMAAAMTSRVASLRVKRARAGARWVSIASPSGPSVRPAVVGDEVGLGERLGDEPADDLAVGPAAGPRREPAHDLAEVAGAASRRSRRCPRRRGRRSPPRSGPGAGTRRGCRSPPAPWSARSWRPRLASTPRPTRAGS